MAFNNRLFTAGTIGCVKRNKEIHPAMTRLYEAARLAGVITPENEERAQSALADALGVAPQNVNNWESKTRGPSADILLSAQRRFGINATWVLHGEGRELIDSLLRSYNSSDIAEAVKSTSEGVRPLYPQPVKPWPFREETLQRVRVLSERDLGYIEGRLSKELDDLDKQRTTPVESANGKP